MSQFLVKTFLRNMPQVSTNKLFKSPSGLIFECCGITKAVLITIDKIEVHLDFHIFAILDFDLLIAYPFEKLFLEKPSHGSLNEKLGKTTFTTPISRPESPMAKHHLNHDRFEEVKSVSQFVSPKLSCEIERLLSPSLELKQCPSGNQNIILDSGQDSTLILQDIVLKNEKFCAMDNREAPTLESKEMDSTDEHENFSFKIPQDSCSLLESLKIIFPSITSSYEDPNHLLILICKLFRKMVVDAFVYHKYCKSHSCTMVLTL